MTLEQQRQQAAEFILRREHGSDDFIGSDDFKDGFNRGAEWEANRPKWFDAKDYCPPQSGMYIVEEFGCNILIRFYDGEKNRWDSGSFIKKWAYIPNF